MKGPKEISYDEFGKLEFLDYFSRNKNYLEKWGGGLVSGIGSPSMEGYNWYENR